MRHIRWPVSLATLCVLLLPLATHPRGTVPLTWASEWRVKDSDHFQVYYRDDPAFASEVLREGERLYSRINAEFGFDRVVKSEHLSFWLWEDRCKIYLYRDREEYVRSTGAPRWSAGRVNYRKRIMHSFNGAATFLDSILPHEMAHILFREYVGFDNPNVPRWLDEGVAQYAEEGKRGASLQKMAAWVGQGRYIPLATLNRVHPGRLESGGAHLFYTQAASLVHFFLEHYGGSRFIDFCSNLRDGYPIERALSFATGSRVASLGELEEAWRRYVLRQ